MTLRRRPCGGIACSRGPLVHKRDVLALLLHDVPQVGTHLGPALKLSVRLQRWRG